MIETDGGDELFAWTGGVLLRGDQKAIVATADLTVGIGALWEVTTRAAT